MIDRITQYGITSLDYGKDILIVMGMFFALCVALIVFAIYSAFVSVVGLVSLIFMGHPDDS